METHDSSTSSSSPSPSASSRLAVRPRRRAQHQNSKKGCLTCKQRHMKCDETEPICLRCQRSNRECVKDKRQASKPAFRAFKVVSFPTPAPPPARKLRPEGVVYLEYFCRQTLPMLSRCQPSPVWRAVTHLLQDPSSSLRHVASAVGYQHLASDTGQTTSAHLEFALTAHAVGALRNSIAEAPRDDVVEPLFAACFLTMLESLQGSVSKTMTHLEGGIRLARERVTRQTTTPEISDCLRFMEDHARAIVLLEAPSDAGRRSKLLLSIDQLPKQSLQLPDVLQTDGGSDDGASIISAIHQQEIRMVSLFLAYHRGEANIRTTPPSGAEAQFFTQVVRSLRAQQVRLETFVDAKLTHNSVTRDDTLAARYSIAKAKCLLQRIILGMETNYVQTDWDRSLDDFVSVLDWIEIALDRLRAAGKRGGGSPLASSPSAQINDAPPAAFSLGMGVHDPLMMVAVKCRDPAVRRRAVALFDKCPRREGPWSTLRARRMCTTVISYEERRAMRRMESTSTPPHRLCLADMSNHDRAFLNHITDLRDETTKDIVTQGVRVYVPDQSSTTGWITEDLPFEDLPDMI